MDAPTKRLFFAIRRTRRDGEGGRRLDDGTIVVLLSLVRRDSNEEEGPWPSSSFSFVDRRGDLAAAFIARYIRPAISGVRPLFALSAGFYSASRRRARSRVGRNASHPPSSTDSSSRPYSLLSPMAPRGVRGRSEYPAMMRSRCLVEYERFSGAVSLPRHVHCALPGAIGRGVDGGSLEGRKTGGGYSHEGAIRTTFVVVGDNNDNIEDDADAFLGGTQRVRHWILTGRIKLANLASYLPNPILCGFLLIGGIERVVVGVQGRCGNDIGQHGVRECHVDGQDRTSRAERHRRRGDVFCSDRVVCIQRGGGGTSSLRRDFWKE